ncbi:hypothetical protein AAVH_12947 [Aphelenchoides avenae]|nr:hypothetical protein AAVH_12947 [Aphelenchus avenae]
MSADAGAVLRTINADRQSTTPSKTETGSDNSARAGHENSARGKEQLTTDADDNQKEPVSVWEDSDDEMDDEMAEKTTQMLVTVMQLLDPDTVFQMQISNSSMRKMVTQNRSTFARRRITRALLTRDCAELTTPIGFNGEKVVRKTHLTIIGRTNWFFNMLQNAYVEQLDFQDVAVNMFIARCMRKTAPTVRVGLLSCVNVTWQFDSLKLGSGLECRLNQLYDQFDDVKTVDLSASPALLPEVNNKVIKAFTTNTRVNSLYLPKPTSREPGTTLVNSPALLDFVFQQSAPQQDAAARAVRVLDIYAPKIDKSFTRHIAKRFRANQGTVPVVLKIHFAPHQDIDKHNQVRADGTWMHIMQCKRCKHVRIRLRYPRKPAPRQTHGSRAAASPTASSES